MSVPGPDRPSTGRPPDPGDAPAAERAPGVAGPGRGSRWRCAQCGNLTRFDVVRASTVREFWHFDLAGEVEVEAAEVLAEELAEVSCRWCGATTVEVVPRPGA